MSTRHKYRKRHTAALTATALAAIFGSSTASAVDFDGYFRAGPGATSKGNARACYNLGINGGHYRLGNECDFYGEFGLAQVGNVDGVTYKAKVMFNQGNSGTDIGGSRTGLEQMYVEAKGFDVYPDGNFWIGKRFYGRTDVHILDKFFVNMSGVGGGVDQIPLAGGKFGVAYFSSDASIGGFDDGASRPDTGTGNSTSPGNRFNADLTEVPVNPGGKLRVTATYTNGYYDNAASGKGTDGFGLSLQHTQELLGIGGENTFWLQYAQGSAGLDGNFGTKNAPSSVKQYLIVESFIWQTGPLGGQAVALYGRHDKDDVNLSPKYSEMSIGGRASYAVTKNFKLIAEAGYMEKRPDGEDKQRLGKLTFAPALSVGPGFFKRPELRLYVTTARWNAAANNALTVRDPNTGAITSDPGLTGLGNGKTRGTSYGLQAEIWF